MSIRACAILFSIFLLAPSLAAESLPFEICAESTTWTRPTPEVQAKIWNDNRYKDVAGTAVEWTHNFIMTDPESASIQYHSMNMSGLWTAAPGTFAKYYSPPRRGYEWIEVWVLLHRVTTIQHDNNTYTFTVQPTGAGFQSVFIRRLNPRAVLRFVTPDGKELEKWDESAPPGLPHSDTRNESGGRIIGPNGVIIRN